MMRRLLWNNQKMRLKKLLLQVQRFHARRRAVRNHKQEKEYSKMIEFSLYYKIRLNLMEMEQECHKKI